MWGRAVCCGLLTFSNHRKTLSRDPDLRSRSAVQGSLLDRSVPPFHGERGGLPSFFDLGFPLEWPASEWEPDFSKARRGGHAPALRWDLGGEGAATKDVISSADPWDMVQSLPSAFTWCSRHLQAVPPRSFPLSRSTSEHFSHT